MAIDAVLPLVEKVKLLAPIASVLPVPVTSNPRPPIGYTLSEQQFASQSNTVLLQLIDGTSGAVLKTSPTSPTAVIAPSGSAGLLTYIDLSAVRPDGSVTQKIVTYDLSKSPFNEIKSRLGTSSTEFHAVTVDARGHVWITATDVGIKTDTGEVVELDFTQPLPRGGYNPNTQEATVTIHPVPPTIAQMPGDSHAQTPGDTNFHPHGVETVVDEQTGETFVWLIPEGGSGRIALLRIDPSHPGQDRWLSWDTPAKGSRGTFTKIDDNETPGDPYDDRVVATFPVATGSDVNASRTWDAPDQAATTYYGWDGATPLPGSYLGLAQGKQISIDSNAAGHGWFVDPTPAKDEEFTTPAFVGQKQAIDPQALDNIDLLTVVEHELGHTVGLEDLDPSANDLISGVLATHLRRTPQWTDIRAYDGTGVNKRPSNAPLANYGKES